MGESAASGYAGTTAGRRAQAGWGVVAMLAAAQFVMVLDTTVMNVSISQVVADLDTTVVGLQSAITMYTLVMAAFMLIGGKLGDRWGAKRTYVIGLLVYGTGSLITALSPNLPTLLVGWSLVEGIGATFVIPSIAALIATTYTGRQRALCYGILGGVGGASAAAGPLIGGWVTANFSWRYVFGAETLIVLFLMLFLKAIPPTTARASKLDVPGAVLSVAGLGAVVLGILQSSRWGWVTPRPGVPEVGGEPLAPLGLSPTLWLIALGAVLLTLFARREQHVKAAGAEPLLDFGLFGIAKLRAGLVIQWCQAFIIQATFFVLPLYLQTVLGFDALETGTTILPLSLALFGFALGGSALSGRFSPRLIVQRGLGALLLGEVLLLAFLGPDLRSVGFAVGMALLGAGLGLLASQVGNVIMSSVDPERGGEAGGLQGTALNLGASLGVALVGSIVIGMLASNFSTAILAEADLPLALRERAAAAAEGGASFLSTGEVERLVREAGVPETQARRVVAVYADAQLAALRTGLAFLVMFALGALAWVRSLPTPASAVVQEG